MNIISDACGSDPFFLRFERVIIVINKIYRGVTILAMLAIAVVITYGRAISVSANGTFTSACGVATKISNFAVAGSGD